MRDITPTVDPPTHRPLHPLGRLIHRMINIRIHMLHLHIARTRKRHPHRASAFHPVL